MGRKASIITVAVLFLALASVLAIADSFNKVVMSEKPEGVEITVYNGNYGLVKEVRSQDLAKGYNEIYFTGVADLIDPTTVTFEDLTYSSELLEQNYEYDLVSTAKLFEKYIGEIITVRSSVGDKAETKTGKLLSRPGDSVILEGSDGKVHVVLAEEATFPELSEGLITEPTLHWIVDSPAEGEHKIETTYMTDGIDWDADYIATVNADDTRLDITSWVTIDNNAGATFESATLKLVAGDVNRASKSLYRGYDFAIAEAAVGSAPQSFSEETLSEYHIYTLERPATLLDNQQKQISFVEAENVPLTKEMIYDEYEYGTSVANVVTFENKDTSNLGIPLPAGTVRMLKADSTGALQFIGEDAISHTPKNEEIELNLGSVFDVVVEKTQTDYTRVSDTVYEYTTEIEVGNQKDKAVTVTVKDHAYGSFEVVTSNPDYEKEDANTLKWEVYVPANSEETVTYTLRFTEKSRY